MPKEPPLRWEPLPEETQWAKLKWNWPYLLVLLLSASQWIGAGGWGVDYFSAVANVALSLTSLTLVFVMQRQRRRIVLLALTDKLTGLFNSNHLQTQLNRSVAFAHRTGTPLSLIFTDLDNLKPVNDRYGHQAGDRLLFDFGQFLLRCVRRNVDLCFRFGGDEFLVLCPLMDIDQARVVAERICRNIREEPNLKAKGVTASLGVAQLRDGERARDLLRRADANLYIAKDNGKNRTAWEALTLETGKPA